MKIILNGEPLEIASNSTVSELLESLNINPAQVIVELNKAITNRESWDTLSLKENDSMEVLRFVGGG